MNSRIVIGWLLGLGLVIQFVFASNAPGQSVSLARAAGANESSPKPVPEGQYPIPQVPGLEIIRGEDVIIKGPKGKAYAHKFKDGRICTFGDGNKISHWSQDGGKTWQEGTLGPSDKMVLEFKDGEILSIKRDIIPRPDGKFTARYWRSTDNWKTIQDAEGIVDVPLATSTGSDDGVTVVPSMMMHHGIVELKDGTLVATLYGNYKGDRVLCAAYPVQYKCFKTRVVAITSTDRGKTWGNPVTIAYDTMLGVLNEPDITGKQLSIVPATTQEGFNEPDLTIAPNGDIVCVMRSGGAVGAGFIPTWATPMYVSRSSDGGKAWSVPEQMSECGTNPNLITLGNGVIVCSYSRPGAWVIFSADNGKTWKGATQFGPNNNYVYIADVGPDKFQVYREGPSSSIIASYFTVHKSDMAPARDSDEYPYFRRSYYHLPRAFPEQPTKVYPVQPIAGLELTRGETVNLPGARPLVFRLNDGRIFVSSGNPLGYWSEDGGKSFKEGPVGPSDKMAFDFGDGEIISITRDLIPRPDGKFTVKYRRSTDNWKTVQDAEGIADVPLATSTGSDQGGTVPSMMMHHGMVLLKDGTLLATLYGNYKGDREFCDAYNVELGCFKTRVVVISSTDRGKTWGNPVTVAYDTMLGVLNEPDITGNQLTIVPAITQEGFNEPDLTIAPNGDVICVMRSGGAWGSGFIPTWPTPMYVSRSSDGGKTWSVPQQFADRGVCSQLVTLKNGIIVCSYSRPGAWLIFSDDNGKTWKGAQQFDYHNNYIYIVEAGDDTVFATRYARPKTAGAVGTFFTVRKKT